MGVRKKNKDFLFFLIKHYFFPDPGIFQSQRVRKKNKDFLLFVLTHPGEVRKKNKGLLISFPNLLFFFTKGSVRGAHHPGIAGGPEAQPRGIAGWFGGSLRPPTQIIIFF